MNIKTWYFSVLLLCQLPGSRADQHPFNYESLQQPTFEQPFYALGKFDAISEYDNTNTYNLSYIQNASTGALYALSQTNSSIAVLQDDPFSGSMPSQMLALNEDSFIAIIDGKPELYNVNNLTSSELNGWSDVGGSVESVYIDSDDQLIYFGGNLSYQDSTYGVVTYDYTSDQIVDLPFGGFNKDSQVNSILKYQADSIIFGGVFYSVGNESLLNYNSTTNSTNSTSNDTYQDPNQLVSLKYADISSVNSQDSGTAKDIICPSSGSSWALGESQLGSWSAALSFTIVPSKIRIYNSKDSNNGVRIFRVITSPSESIMNLTYIDPDSLNRAYCDAWCTLMTNQDLTESLDNNGLTSYSEQSESNDGQVGFGTTYQEFEFYNSIDVSIVTVQIMDYYGNYAELSGIELYQYGISIYANESLNEPNCDSQTAYSTAEQIGDSSNWKSYADQDGVHLTTNLTSSDVLQSKEQGLKFSTNITTSGNYSIQVNTPGCSYDNTCNERGVVNATFYSGNDTVLGSALIHETNSAIKYDIIYSGEILMDDDDSKPYLTLTFNTASSDDYTIFVADSISVNFTNVDYNSTTSVKNLVPINGLFEYSLTNFTDSNVEFPVGNSSINVLGAEMSDNATITGLFLQDDTLYIAGDFNSTYGENFIGLDISGYNDTSNEISVEGQVSVDGVDGSIDKVFSVNNTTLLLYGDTTNSENDTELKGLSIYNGTFHQLGEFNSTLEAFSTFVYNHTQYWAFKFDDSTFAEIYDTSRDEFISESNTFRFNISSATEVSDIIYGYGQIISLDRSANNLYVISNSTFNTTSSTSGSSSNGTSTNQKSLIRQLTSIYSHTENKAITRSSQNVINSGLFLNDTFVVLGGSFGVNDSSNANVAILNNGSASPVDSAIEFDSDSEVNLLYNYSDALVVAFSGAGTANNTDLKDMFIYNMTNGTLTTLPEEFDDGVIKAFEFDPEYLDLLIGGNFTSSTCDTLCLYSFNNGSLRDSGADISGEITHLKYYKRYEVLMSGDFDDDEKFVIYNTQNRSISTNSSLAAPPGIVKKFMFADNTTNDKDLNDMIISMGDDFIGYSNGSDYKRLDSDIGSSGRKFTDFTLLDTNSTSFFGEKVLLLAGQFTLSQYGSVSSATYNGSTWTPLTIISFELSSNNSALNSILPLSASSSYGGEFNGEGQNPGSPRIPKPSAQEGEHYFSNGQVVGFSLLMAIATTLLLAALCALIWWFTDRNTRIGPLEERVGEEKMMSALPPSKLINQMDLAKMQAQ